MRYELWHIESANLMDDFETDAEALDVARAYLAPDKNGAIIDVALVVYDDAAQAPLSLHGADLASLVVGPSQHPVRRSS